MSAKDTTQVTVLGDPGADEIGSQRAVSALRIVRIDPRTASDDVHRLLCELTNRLRAEEMPDDPPILLAEHLANNRNIPGFVDVTVWAVCDAATSDTVAGSELGGSASAEARQLGHMIAAAHLGVENLEHNRHLPGFGIGVLPEYRRRGIGRRLLGLIADAARDAGRTLLMSHTNGNVPAGDAFLSAISAQAALPSHKNQLDIGRDLDRSLLRSWYPATDSAVAAEYSLTIEQGRYSPEELPAIVELFNRVVGDVPRGDLQMDDYRFTVEQARQQEDSMFAGGTVEHWTAFVRCRQVTGDDERMGEYVGITDVMWNANRPMILSQNLTAVLPEHRGKGLGRRLKAALLERLLAEHPEIRFVRTNNADTNAAMLAINTAMGFKPYYVETAWQIEIGKVFDYLGRSITVAQ